ncbi:MAG TPA: cache domain-containing protein, partial [Stellaceae bacterium]|nr:cache domain-containing protein [Stellaceae bacterium]
MTLRIRISIFVFFAVMLLTVGILFGEVDRIGLLEDRIESLTLENQVAAWEGTVDTAASALSDKAAALVSTRELATAVRDHNNDLLQVLLAGTAQDVGRIDLLDGDGNLVYSTDQDINTTPLIDAGLVFKLMADNSAGAGLEADQRGDIMVTMARPLSVNQDQVGVLVIANRLSSVAAQLKTATGSDTILLDAKGKPILSNVDPKLLPVLMAKLGKPRTGITLVPTGDKVYRLGQTVISSASGNRIGYEVAVSDVTQSYEHDRGRQFLAYLVMIAT